MSADVARGHGGDGGGEDRRPSSQNPTGDCFNNRGKGKRKPNLGGRGAGRLNTRSDTRNLATRLAVQAHGRLPIQFDMEDQHTRMPTGPNAAKWGNVLGEEIRKLPQYYPSWEAIPEHLKASVISEIGALFDLRPHRESSDWLKIRSGINAHCTKSYNTSKAAFKAKWWVRNEEGNIDVERIRRNPPSGYEQEDWDKQVNFWNDPKNIARAEQNSKNRAKSKVVSRQGSRSVPAFRHLMMRSSETQEYPSLIDTFFRHHTIDGVFQDPGEKALYEEMIRLRALGSNTPSGVPYTDEEIMMIVRPSKGRGHLPGIGRVVSDRSSFPDHASEIDKLKKDNKKMKKKNKKIMQTLNMFTKFFRQDDRFSQMLTQANSTPGVGTGSSTGGNDNPDLFIIDDDDDDSTDED